ncbi:universal stress protein [Silvimonas soli]|uniref:universal stress protein n=1 Tax=Silvimonas soli TaxID=2980100 RepID=UPI0024B35E18|nr:universal stress protein [Silvimonas soli]
MANMNILVPVDGSDNAQRALEHAASLVTHNPNLALRLLNVQQPGLYASVLEGIEGMEPMTQLLHQQGEEVLAPYIEWLNAKGVAFSTRVRLGKPFSVICEQASHHDCQRVVMGTRGNEGLDRFMLGSVAAQVAATAPVPVTLIK